MATKDDSDEEDVAMGTDRGAGYAASGYGSVSVDDWQLEVEEGWEVTGGG